MLVALKNQMDLAVGIAVGSALQIALFVAPVLVFASYLRAEPMDLRFTSLEVVAVILGVLIARMVAEDGESNWLEGLMLLMVYAILALAFFFLPERPSGSKRRPSRDRRAVPVSGAASSRAVASARSEGRAGGHARPRRLRVRFGAWSASSARPGRAAGRSSCRT